MVRYKSLTKRIRLSFVLIAALPLIGFGLLGLPILEESLTSEAFLDNRAVANHVRESIEDFLDAPLQTLHVLQSIRQRFPDDQELLNTIMDEVVRQSSILEAIFLTDENRRVTHLGLTPSLSPQRDDFLGIDLSAHSLFKHLPRQDGTIWSDTYTSLLTGKPALLAGLPVGRHQMLVANINLESLNDLLLRDMNIQEGTQVVVVDANGVVVAHSDPNNVRVQMNLHHHPAIQQGLSGREETRIYDFEGQKLLGSVIHVPSTGWEVYVARDMSASLALLFKTRTSLIAAILVALVLAITAGIQNARHIIRPIEYLSEQTRRIAAGVYELEPERDAYREIAVLTRDFATMGAAVREREQALRDKTDECRMIFDNSNDGISLVHINDDDSLGHYSEVNEVLYKRLGYSREELEGLSPLELLTVEGQERAHDLVSQLRRQDHILFEAGQVTRNGEQVPVELTARLVKVQNREMVYILTRDIRERKHAAEMIEKMAFFDSLTGLPNRHLLHDRLGQAVSNAGRDAINLAVLFINLDRLKGINDNYGHDFGDRLLHETGRRLSATVRGNDVVGRWGGDEFVVLLWQVAHPEHCTLVAKKILAALNEPLNIDGEDVAVSASLGISLFPQDAENVDQLVTTADLAMQHAKREGQNVYQYYSQSMNSWARERMQLESSLRYALDRGEFELYFQPRVDALSLEVVGLEALLRWQHPQLGRVAPDRFIPIAEETGLIRPIGEWVLRSACAQLSDLHRRGYPELRVGVNVSSQQLRNANFFQQVERALVDHRLEPDCLELELTERALVDNSENNLTLFSRLRALGVHLALDDFGVGYSSLAQLKQFPLDILKIDRSFVAGIPDDRNLVALTEAILAMGMSLELEIIAEGIETEEQHRFLAARDCNSLQGFHFCRPIPFDELLRFLENHRGLSSDA